MSVPQVPGFVNLASVNVPGTIPTDVPLPSAVKGTSHVVHNRVDIFPLEGKVEYMGAYIDVTLDGVAETKTEKKCTVTIDGVTTVIPAPAGHVRVAHGRIIRNGMTYPRPVVVVTTKKKKKKAKRSTQKASRPPQKSITKKPRP